MEKETKKLCELFYMEKVRQQKCHHLPKRQFLSGFFFVVVAVAVLVAVVLCISLAVTRR